MDHRLDHDSGFLTGFDLGNQRLVELDPVERHSAQPREVGIAGSKIVDRDRRALRPKRRNLGQIGLVALHRRGLGEFQLDHRQRNILRRKRMAQPREKIDPVKLARADVEGQPAVDPLRFPAGQDQRHLVHHPVADFADHAGLFGDRNKRSRRAQTVARMLPA